MALNIDPLGAWKSNVDAANEIGRKIIAAKSDRGEQVKSILETSDDEKIVKFRAGKAAILEQIETLQAKITNAEASVKEHAETLIPGVDKDFDVEKATAEFLAKRKAAHASKQALLNFVTEEQLAEAAKEMGISEVIALRGHGSGSKGGGTGVKRPRISAATLNGAPVWKKGEEGKKVDFTSLAAAAKSDADTLKKAAFKAAETEDLNDLPAGHVVEFTVGDNVFTVTISGEKPGRPAAAKPEEEKK